MSVIQKILALGVLAVCIVMLLRLCLSGPSRRTLDGWGHALMRLPVRLTDRLRASRGSTQPERRTATSARSGEWEGNVYKPKSFRGPRKLH